MVPVLMKTQCKYTTEYINNVIMGLVIKRFDIWISFFEPLEGLFALDQNACIVLTEQTSTNELGEVLKNNEFFQIL